MRTVICVYGPLEVRSGHAHILIELRRVQHPLSELIDRHPLLADVATNLFNRHQEVLLAYPQKASRRSQPQNAVDVPQSTREPNERQHTPKIEFQARLTEGGIEQVEMVAA